MGSWKFGDLLSALDAHADTQPNHLALRFLTTGDVAGAVEELTFAEFRNRACQVAAELRQRLAPLDRALLFYDGGIDFIVALYGCFYAGVIAVPTYPPDSKRIHRTLPRLQSIVKDAGAKLVLTSDDLRTKAEPLCESMPGLGELTWLSTEHLPNSSALSRRQSDVAYLQYTSGSTGAPKGVVISHDNLAVTCGDMLERWPYDEHSHQVSWLPTFHDLGLIWGLMTPLLGGFGVTFMSPPAFLQRPARWLEAITKYRGTTTAAPNFAYDLAARKVSDDELARLDLTSLRAAMNAAEPVRPKTLDAFAKRFASVGFRSEAMCPWYGLAEATLQVSVSRPREGGARILALESAALERHEVVVAEGTTPSPIPAVSCGTIAPMNQVAIVDPETFRRVDGVGEIWVSGPTVARGYWGNIEATRETFEAQIEGESRSWLRTGDLGFMREGELYITGRAKDVLIIRGRNLYPQDLEMVAESVDPALRPGCSAAFPLVVHDEERVGLVIEFDADRSRTTPAEIIQHIRSAVAENFEIQLHDVALIAPRSIHKTSSGKIQRRRTREALLAGEYEIACRWTSALVADRAPSIAPDAVRRRGEAFEELLWNLIRNAGDIDLGSLPARDVPFRELGIDSVGAVEASGRIADYLKRPLPTTLLFDHPTLSDLATYLRGQSSKFAAHRSRFDRDEPIAIVGIGCRFPGGITDPASYWDFLIAGGDAITEVPESRWPVDEFYDPDSDAIGKMNTRWGGFVSDLERFDAAFFNISPREAVSIDPQQRLLLETSWEALERAGIDPTTLNGSETGVYMGLCSNDYHVRSVTDPDAIDAYSILGTAHSAMVGRLSYWLGLHGPNIAVDTACSSSLVAVHLACRALRNGDCDLALAGGANAVLNPEGTIYFSRLGAMSPTGRCRTFSADADGYVRSEGAGVIVLERLSVAQEKGHRIWAVIRGSAVNQDGKSDGFTAPNGSAQSDLIESALADADIGASDLDYVECHGTGTPLGDPIEVNALASVLERDESVEPRPRLAIGSVKSNIGHTEGAAGVAGLIKVALCLEHRQLTRTLHFTSPNPSVAWETLPLEVITENRPWSTTGRPRRAGISSFGFSGTNAHVILEEAPSEDFPPRSVSVAGSQLIVLSGRTPAAVNASGASLLRHLERHPEFALEDIAHSLATTRAHFGERLAFVVPAREALFGALQQIAENQTPPIAVRASVPSFHRKVAWLFTGQGSQRSQMGKALFDAHPAFKNALERVALEFNLPKPLLEVMFKPGESERLDRTDFTQPALFALEVALGRYFQSIGFTPHYLLGHSIGEYAAAHLAGVFDLPDACRLVNARGRLMQALPSGVGAMASLSASDIEVEAALASLALEAEIAGYNGPTQTVVSGDVAAVHALTEYFEKMGRTTKRLHVSHAFHSRHMEPMIDAFREVAYSVRYRAPSVPLISTVTGQVETSALANPEYWVTQARAPVRFRQAMETAKGLQVSTFVELGPHPVLSGMGAETIGDAFWIAPVRKGDDERTTFLHALSQLYAAGQDIDWSAFFAPFGGRPVELPTYPFQRHRYWIDRRAGIQITRDLPLARAADTSTMDLDLARRLAVATPSERRQILFNFVRALVTQVLGLPSTDAVDADKPLMTYGMDSLLSIQLKKKIESGLGRDLRISAALTFNYPTVNEISDFLAAGAISQDTASRIRSRAADVEAFAEEPLAIIGMGCRFPGGADDPESFWDLLKSGRDAITEVPAERWEKKFYFSEDLDAAGKSYSAWGGFVNDVDKFDAQFFEISPHEATAIDPQHRLLLEVSHRALEDACIAPSRLSGSRTGVFFGITTNDYAELVAQSEDRTRLAAHLPTGNSMNMAAGRVSFAFNLRGPALVVDTACSSALTALHLAEKSLRRRECNLALVGGVNVLLNPEHFVELSRMRALSPTGRCRTFDKSADGYVRAEGCGVVVLKRYSEALSDNDKILALVRGVSINHDGKSSSLTAPNGLAQQALLREALANAGVRPSEVGYVEAHGTGTPLGDPIEVHSLSTVMNEGREAPLYVGSVKANVGHLEAAAGMASLMKVVLSLRHREIPRQIHFSEINPHIALDEMPIVIPREHTAWPALEGKRIAGISAFGFSGTNAHVLVQEALVPQPIRAPGDRTTHLLTVSAKSKSALRALAKRYSDQIESFDLGDFCYSVNAGRSHYRHRMALVGASSSEIRSALQDFVAEKSSVAVRHADLANPPRPAFLFTGQGSQYAGMGKATFETEAVFRGAIESCTEIVARFMDEPLLPILWGDRSELLQDTRYTQPALFVFEYALCQLWRSWGIEPAYLLGHSVGEFVAATIAGIFSLEDAIRLVVKRAELMASLPKIGQMASISASEACVREALEPYRDQVDIAALNGPENVVISGEGSAVAAIRALFDSRGIKTQALVVSHAFHSPLMDPILDEFEAAAKEARYLKPHIRIISNVTGRPAEGDAMCSAKYWREHLRGSVRFAEGMASLYELGCRQFLEIGPQPVLTSLGQLCVPLEDEMLWLASMKRDADESRQLHESLGVLYAHGATIDWASYDSGMHRTKVAVSSYPFERTRQWVKPKRRVHPSEAPARLLGAEIDPIGLGPGVHIFESQIARDTFGFISDHRVYDSVVLPGAAYVELALEAASVISGSNASAIEGITFERPLTVKENGAYRLRVVVQDKSFQVFSAFEDGGKKEPWILHVTGRISTPNDASKAVDVSAVRSRCVQEIAGKDCYATFAAMGLGYGPAFQGLEYVRRGLGEALARLRPSAELKGDDKTTYRLFPGLLDSCFQVLGFCLNDADSAYMPIEIKKLELNAPVPNEALWCHAQLVSSSAGISKVIKANIQLFTEAGDRIASVEGISQVEVSRQEQKISDDRVYGVEWIPKAAPAANALVGTVLIVAHPEEKLAHRLREDIHRLGARPVLATFGEDYRCLEDLHFEIDAERSEHFERLFKDIAPIRAIVHLGSLAIADDPALDDITNDQKWGYGNILALSQALSNTTALSEMPLLALITQDVETSIFQAPTLGIGKVIALEQPDLKCRTIDLDRDADSTANAEAITSELTIPDDERQIAYRGGVRSVARFTLSSPTLDHEAPSLRDDATYLITGGLGSLGLLLADWMCGQGAKNLVLVGRRDPSPEAEALVGRLREGGARVVISKTDVSDERQAKAMLEDITESLPPLRGIVHAAGSLDDGVLAQQTWDRFIPVMRPKIVGGWVLHRLTQNRPLDFFVLFSSAASVLGNAGQGNYGAANAFLDALAHRRHALKLPALSVNWGPWGDTGMAARMVEKRGQSLEGLSSIPARDNLDLLKSMLRLRSTWDPLESTCRHASLSIL